MFDGIVMDVMQMLFEVIVVRDRVFPKRRCQTSLSRCFRLDGLTLAGKALFPQGFCVKRSFICPIRLE